MKVSVNDQHVWGDREKYPEIEGMCVAAHCKQIGRIICRQWAGQCCRCVIAGKTKCWPEE